MRSFNFAISLAMTSGYSGEPKIIFPGAARVFETWFISRLWAHLVQHCPRSEVKRMLTLWADTLPPEYEVENPKYEALCWIEGNFQKFWRQNKVHKFK
jgi:hypothetical protein